MARVTGPLHSDSASGQVGQAIVYGNWKGQPWVRNWVKPTNPQSGDQQAARARLATAVACWQNLTPWEREQWDNYALDNPHVDPVTGLTSPWSGFNAFSHVSIAYQMAECAGFCNPTVPLYAPPNVPYCVQGITCDFSDTAQVINWLSCSGPCTPYDPFVFVYRQAYLGPGEKPSFKKANWLGFAKCTDLTWSSPGLPEGTIFAHWLRMFNCISGQGIMGMVTPVCYGQVPYPP